VYPSPEPLSEKYRRQLGTIGVARGPFVPVIQFDMPPTGVLERTGRGALVGADKSALWWWDKVLDSAAVAADRFPPFGTAAWLTLLVLTLPVTIVGGFGGAIYYGAFAADEPSETVEESESTLRHTIAELPIQETFQAYFLNETRSRTSQTFVVVPEQGPQMLKPMDEMFDNVQTYNNKELPTYEGMVGQGADSVLELSVRRIWLKEAGHLGREMNPRLALAIFVRARLVRVTEKTVWYDQTFVNETEGRHHTEWASHQAQAFQEAIEKAYQDLAEEIVEKLFLLTPTTSSAKLGT
jgi:hypothetical protein